MLNNFEKGFYEVLQESPVLIDADIIGSAIVLYGARHAAAGRPVFRHVVRLTSPVNDHARRDLFYHIAQDAFQEGCVVLQNVYTSDDRGALFLRCTEGAVLSGGVPTEMIEISGRANDAGQFTMTFHSTVEASPTLSVINALLERHGFVKLGARVTTVSMVGGNITEKNGIIDVEKLGQDVFYPFLKGTGVSLEEYIAAYLESDASILFLIGPPGTGKSTFVRTVINQSGLSARLSSDKEAILSGGLFSGGPDEDEVDGDRILAMEDVDDLTGSRERYNDFMSRILNETDGVTKSRVKLIISTNLKTILDVDEALIRPERTFDILEFSRLDYNDAVLVAMGVGTDVSLLEEGQSYTLAEVTGKRKKGTAYFSYKGSTRRTSGFLR